MTIFGLLLVLFLIGVGLYLLELVPMDATIKRIIQVVAIVIVILWVLQALLGFDTGIKLR